MAVSGEKSGRDEKDLRDETVAIPADPDATVLADAAPADPDATVLADAAPTTMLDDGLPTTVVPRDDAAPTTALDAGDGIDALDDPYFSPAAPEDLTSVREPMVSIPSPVQSLPERKRRLPAWAIALIVAALLALGGGVAYYTYDQELWGGKTVPAVLGMTQEEATALLEGMGFVVNVEPVVSDDDHGTVLSCSPDPGVRADPKDGVTLGVSSERVVPKVVGLDEEAAREALLAAGAQNIQVSSEGSSQPAGTVISVTPGEGEPFSAEDLVTLVVARAYTVPDVLGKSLEEALFDLEQAGLTGTVSYVDSTSEGGTVIETVPGVGTQIAGGSAVELRVAVAYPDEAYDLMAYFGVPSEALSTYLTQSGYTLEYGELYASGGNAHAAWSGSRGDLLQISNYPETGHYAGGSQVDVLAQGAGVGGVRYAFSADTLPTGGGSVSEEGLRAVMAACGLDGLEDACTQDDIVAPGVNEKKTEEEPADEEPSGDAGNEGAPEAPESEAGEDGGQAAAEQTSSPSFICGCGRQDGYVWAVIIGGRGESTSVVTLVAPSAHFDTVDLSPFGGSVCDYIAYIDLYTG